MKWGDVAAAAANQCSKYAEAEADRACLHNVSANREKVQVHITRLTSEGKPFAVNSDMKYIGILTMLHILLFKAVVV